MQDGTGLVKKFSSLKTLMEGDLFQRYFRETQKENSVIFLFSMISMEWPSLALFLEGLYRGSGKAIEGCWAINVRKFSKSS